MFKRHFTQVEFYVGSVMNAKDLERVAVSEINSLSVISVAFKFECREFNPVSSNKAAIFTNAC